LLISTRNSFRVLFDKIASVYFLFEKYIYILALEMVSAWEPALCQLYQHTCVRRSMVDYLHINALTLSFAILWPDASLSSL